MAEDKEKKMSKEELTAMRVANLRKNQYRGGRKPQTGETRKTRAMWFTDDEYEVIKTLGKILKHNPEKGAILRMIAREEQERQKLT